MKMRISLYGIFKYGTIIGFDMKNTDKQKLNAKPWVEKLRVIFKIH